MVWYHTIYSFNNNYICTYICLYRPMHIIIWRNIHYCIGLQIHNIHRPTVHMCAYNRSTHNSSVIRCAIERCLPRAYTERNWTDEGGCRPFDPAVQRLCRPVCSCVSVRMYVCVCLSAYMLYHVLAVREHIVVSSCWHDLLHVVWHRSRRCYHISDRYGVSWQADYIHTYQFVYTHTTVYTFIQ